MAMMAAMCTAEKAYHVLARSKYTDQRGGGGSYQSDVAGQWDTTNGEDLTDANDDVAKKE